jgi:hypothetical protein
MAKLKKETRGGARQGSGAKPIFIHAVTCCPSFVNNLNNNIMNREIKFRAWNT